ncbi:peptidase, S8/S53 family [Bifidobacterium anseris]|uniref:Peptidase, S8/S53 family n=2 Tax=Bifidobacterium anseris TaxID=2020963 RepID=A0A2N5IZI8_9BIFI|nr:peptidase, S8/S53 family [Bifidobacterium anseris]
MGVSRVVVRVRAVCVVVVAAVLALALVVTPSVWAVELDAGDWYVTKTGAQDAWSQGVTGKGVKVAVLDDQLVVDYPGIAGKQVASRLVLPDGASSCVNLKKTRMMRVSDPALRAGDGGIYVTHGTMMTAYIVGDGSGYDGNRGLVGVAQNAQVTHYPLTFGSAGLSGFSEACSTNGKAIDFAGSVRQAVANGDRIINLSFEGRSGSDMVEAYVGALRAGVVVVSGSGNDTEDSGPKDYVGEPTKINRFPGVLAVNGADESGNANRRDGGVTLLAPSEGINRYAVGDARVVKVDSGGSSSASAITSGMLALVMSKWPDATGNQVLQSVVRNTRGNTSGEPVFDRDLRAGFGVIDLPRLLATDPSQYPDVNPLLEAAVANSEKHEETRGMYTDHSDWTQLAGMTDPFGLDDSSGIDVPKEADLVGEEYERQKAAWAKVEQCRKDGGADCMQYSATRTGQAMSSSTSDNGQAAAPKADGAGASGVTTSSASSSSGSVWLWAALGSGIVAVAALIVVACLVVRRRRRLPVAVAPVPAAAPPMPANASGASGLGGYPPAGPVAPMTYGSTYVGHDSRDNPRENK